MGTAEAYGSNLINSPGNGYREITWDDWNELTHAQQQAIPRAVITDVPGVNGTVNAELLKTLWVNPSIGTVMAQTSITLSSADYDFLLVTYRFVYNNALTMSSIAPKGANIMLNNGWYDASTPYAGVATRAITRTNDTSYTIGAGSVFKASTGYGTDNSVAVPIAIYGIKKSISLDISAVISNVSTDASKCMLSNGKSVESAVTKITQSQVRCITTSIYLDTTTAGSGQSFSLSDVTGGKLTTYAQVKGVGIISIIGYNAYDTGGRISVDRASGNIILIPSVSQPTASADIFILY